MIPGLKMGGRSIGQSLILRLVAQIFLPQKPRILRASSALGFPSKTSAKIALDYRKTSEAAFGLTREGGVQTRINIALCRY